MNGFGHVEPGGPALVARLSSTVTLTKVSVGPMDNNAYLLATADDAVLIDAANDADRLVGVVGDRRVSTIVTTHRHGDHLQALADLARVTGARLIAGTPDLDAVEAGGGVTGVVGVWDGDEIAIGAEHLAVIGLVGHTPGSVALAYRGPGGVTHLFTGDSLFPGGPGKTRRADDFTTLMHDLEQRIFARFDDSTVVHPGHGDDTTLGAERSELPVWRARGW